MVATISAVCAGRISGTNHPPAVAWWVSSPSSRRAHLCQRCLDLWFDCADDDGREPQAWGWLRPKDVTAAWHAARPVATQATEGAV